LNVSSPFILSESQWLFYAFSKLRTLLYMTVPLKDYYISKLL